MCTKLVEVVVGSFLADQLRDEDVALIERSRDIFGFVGDEFVDGKEKRIFQFP
jgi:hypothetical protein